MEHTPDHDPRTHTPARIAVEPGSPPPLPFEHATADQLAQLINQGHDTSDLTRLILNTTGRAA